MKYSKNPRCAFGHLILIMHEKEGIYLQFNFKDKAMLLTVKYVELAVILCDYNCRGTYPVGNLRQLERLNNTNASSLSFLLLVCKLWGRVLLFIQITLMS